MRTNIDIDDELLAEAMRAAGTTTKRSTVEAGLKELIRRHRIRKVRELRGTVEWVGDLDEMRASGKSSAFAPATRFAPGAGQGDGAATA